MQIRHAAAGDMPRIAQIYAIARDYMKRSGNPNQWGTDRPAPHLLEEDLRLQRLYLVTDGSEPETILGCFACIEGKDPTYAYIEGGNWLNDLPYLTLHRIASAGIRKGVLDFIIAHTAQLTSDIRVDTHRDNKTMQHILLKNGFTHCGTIYLENGDPRLAYHRHQAALFR